MTSGHNAVMTVVDSVSKRVYFIPTHTTVTAEGAARLFLHQVWKLHGLSKCVISDRGPQFVVSLVAQFDGNPEVAYLEAAKYILCYLKGTVNFNLVLGCCSRVSYDGK